MRCLASSATAILTPASAYFMADVTCDPCSVKAQRNDGMWRLEGALGTECRLKDRLSTRIRKMRVRGPVIANHESSRSEPGRPHRVEGWGNSNRERLAITNFRTQKER